MIECNICGSRNNKFITSSSTLVCYIPFSDKNGVHDHDENIVLATYECANNHQFNIQLLNQCQCGWQQK